MIRHLVAFDRPLIAVSVPGQASKMYSETEVAAIRARAYEEGSDAARAFASQQLVEFRAEVQSLQEGLFQKLSNAETDLFGQLRDTLPSLAVELARRLLAGFEPSAEQIQRLCEETLAQLYPERDGLELFLAPRDVTLLEDISPAWKNRFPGLKITPDATLGSGDCQVRSRFGLTDARRQAKLEALSRELLSA
ncbi:MAG TPA: FliH/SctL family protein [Opitutaceae bacterium]|nr:FliH/SctL family protein [Opitutaceae bacterium]